MRAQPLMDLRAFAEITQRCQRHPPAGFQERGDIVLPRGFVKIGGQEETGFVQQHRINAHDETTAIVVLTRQMPANHHVGYGKKTLGGDVRNI